VVSFPQVSPPKPCIRLSFSPYALRTPLILFGEKYSRTLLIWTLVIQMANYLDRLGPSGKFVENSTQLTCLEITGHQIKYSTVLWLLELQIRRYIRVKVPEHAVNSNGRTSDDQRSPFSKKKNPFMRIFCLFGCLTVQITPDKWSSVLRVITFRRHLLLPLFYTYISLHDSIPKSFVTLFSTYSCVCLIGLRKIA
jgi:hypothetical protein